MPAPRPIRGPASGGCVGSARAAPRLPWPTRTGRGDRRPNSPPQVPPSEHEVAGGQRHLAVQVDFGDRRPGTAAMAIMSTPELPRDPIVARVAADRVVAEPAEENVAAAASDLMVAGGAE